MVLRFILHFISLLSPTSIKSQMMKLYMLRNNYQYLKVFIIDEILMIRRETFGHLDLVLKTIMQNLSPFGGVSLLVLGDFLQLPSVNQKGVL